jgi:hypothetical protein
MQPTMPKKSLPLVLLAAVVIAGMGAQPSSALEKRIAVSVAGTGASFGAKNYSLTSGLYALFRSSFSRLVDDIGIGHDMV